MANIEIIIVGIGIAVLAFVVLRTVWDAARGKDLAGLEALRHSSPRTYRNLVLVCRTNCAMTSVVCVVGLVASPLAVFAPGGGVLLALACFFGSALFLWLSLRWFLWALRARL